MGQTGKHRDIRTKRAGIERENAALHHAEVEADPGQQFVMLMLKKTFVRSLFQVIDQVGIR